MEQREVPLVGATRRAVIRRGLREEKEVRHQALRNMYQREIRKKEEATLSRKDCLDLARFRTGHHTDLRRCRKMFGRDSTDECRLCGKDVESSAHLWTECGALLDLWRRHQLGEVMSELVEHPNLAMAMLREILSRLR